MIIDDDDVKNDDGEDGKNDDDGDFDEDVMTIFPPLSGHFCTQSPVVAHSSTPCAHQFLEFYLVFV